MARTVAERNWSYLLEKPFCVSTVMVEAPSGKAQLLICVELTSESRRTTTDLHRAMLGYTALVQAKILY